MRVKAALAIGVGAACISLFGCGEAGPSEGVDDAGCVDQPFRAELHVDALDPRKVWATHFASGLDVVVLPRPPGQFRFDGARSTILLNAAGDVLSRSGEITKSGCFDAATGTLYLGPADLPDPNRPPN